MSIRRGYVDTSAGQVHYRVSGPDVGLPVVFFHQTASSSVMFEAVMLRLATRRCVSFDIPGFGCSTAVRPVTVQGWADVLTEAMEIVGTDEIDVVGHHTGASVACAVAIHHPGRVRHLALGGPPLLSRPTRERVRSAIRERAPSADGSHLLAAWRTSAGYAPRGPIDLVQRETLLLLAADAPHLAMQAVLDYDIRPALASIECPVLAFSGDEDPIIEGVAAVAALRPGTVTHAVSHAGVHVFDEQPDAVASMLAAFLDDRLGEVA